MEETSSEVRRTRETIVIDSDDEEPSGHGAALGEGEVPVPVDRRMQRRGSGETQGPVCLDPSRPERRDDAERESNGEVEEDWQLLPFDRQIEWIEEEDACTVPRVLFVWNPREQCFEPLPHPTEEHRKQATYEVRLSQHPAWLLSPAKTPLPSSSSSSSSSSSLSTSFSQSPPACSSSLVLEVPSSGVRMRGGPAWFSVPPERRSREAVNDLWRQVVRHTQVYLSLESSNSYRRLSSSPATTSGVVSPSISSATPASPVPEGSPASPGTCSDDVRFLYPPWLYLSPGVLPSLAHARNVWQQVLRDVAAFLEKKRGEKKHQHAHSQADAVHADATGEWQSLDASLPLGGERNSKVLGGREEMTSRDTRSEVKPDLPRDGKARLKSEPSTFPEVSVKRETGRQASFVTTLLQNANRAKTVKSSSVAPLSHSPSSSAAPLSFAANTLAKKVRPRDGDTRDEEGDGRPFFLPKKKMFLANADGRHRASTGAASAAPRGPAGAQLLPFASLQPQAGAATQRRRDGEHPLRSIQSDTHRSDPTVRDSSLPTDKRGDPGRRDAVYVPLAERLRPASLEEYVGQRGCIQGGRGSIRELLEAGHLPSLILWGPPGCGKTTIALLAGRSVGKKTSALSLPPPVFKKMSAVTCGVNDVRKVVQEALTLRATTKQTTILFLDEIHRFNKAQQDALLPHVETGTITLIGATTENPSFEVNRALLSRCRVCKLEPLTEDDLTTILQRAAKEENVEITEAAVGVICRLADGDARRALNMLENAIHHERTESEKKARDETESSTSLSDPFVTSSSSPSSLCSSSPFRPSAASTSAFSTSSMASSASSVSSPLTPSASPKPPGSREGLGKDGVASGSEGLVVDVASLESTATKSHLLYDKNRDSYYDLISALHKSVRGSDEHAAVYYLTRMLEAGEDPLKVARRIVRMASEDVGLADPAALSLCVAAYQASHFTGMPECSTALTMAVIYLCKCPKSSAVDLAYSKAKSLVLEYPDAPVPLHLRNAPTKLMSQLGYGRGYVHTNQPEATLPQFQSRAYRAQTYLPEVLLGTQIVPNISRPSARGGWTP
ncbi:UNVERIFIED_CONTAM: werner helicase interacting protein 1, putative [Hammondia hammondi]|eukprot:XP_008888300.1 werner helicase interacting protein 1, putative [Hammondia hammondi]